MAVLVTLTIVTVAACAGPAVFVAPPGIPVGDMAFLRTLQAHMAAPVIVRNRVDPLFNGREMFPAALAAIKRAERSITYAQYYWDEGRIGRVLAVARTARRVHCAGWRQRPMMQRLLENVLRRFRPL